MSLALALAWLAYVLPGDRVVGMLAEARASRAPLRIEAKLQARDSSAPSSLVIELHPELGARISDDRGGRWLVSGGRATAGTQLPAPAWLPDLAPLVLRHESELRSWLAAEGVDLQRNELARCGDGDCYVLGTRHSLAQLWVQKSPVEVRRLVLPGRGRSDLEEWRSFDGIRFPARIELSGDEGTATLAVETATPAPKLGPADFSEAWVQAAKRASAR
jgi:hypothetical protein